MTRLNILRVLPRRVRNPSWLLFVLAVVGMVLAAVNLSNVESDRNMAAAVQNAMVLSRSVEAFRGLYTREVVAKLKSQGIKSRHDSQHHPGTVALPISLSLELANEIGATNLRSQVRIYSPYPFPWKAGPALPDEFSRKAWAELSSGASESLTTLEDRNGETFLRYAVADRMGESCVGCHNTYPGTPRGDWKVGDVRGVVEVRLPIDGQFAGSIQEASQSIALFSLFGVLWFGVAGLTLAAARKDKKRALKDAKRHRATSEELQGAIVERELAEKETRGLEEQIQHAQKLESLNLIVGGLAHDFNNLLVPIIANSEMLKDEAAPGSPSLEIIHEVQLASDRAADLCQQMLAYAGKASPAERSSLDLSTALKETGQLLTASIPKNCKIEFDLADELPSIEADSVQISQIALNLITNASEAIGDANGTIQIRTGTTKMAGSSLSRGRAQGGYCKVAEATFPGGGREVETTPAVFLEICDDGAGMDEQTAAKIFDPFFTTKFTGRGLGLAAVQGIVAAHRGEIDVDSELGSHTRIRICLPVSGAVDSLEDSGTIELSQQWEGHGTILLVEDEPSVRAVAQRMLEGIGFTVVTADDGEDAMWRFSREPERFVAALSDLTMPKMDGVHLVREMRKIRSGFPVILFSGYSERVDEIEEMRDEKTLFIQKPFRSLALRSNLRSLIGAQEESKGGEEVVRGRPSGAMARRGATRQEPTQSHDWLRGP
jgi:signal transduction histidine kinase/DNA-binding NarL/FixJ family response regulator